MPGLGRFLFKAALFTALVVGITAVLLVRASRRQVDLFYAKFTSPARSLIVGSSRAAQGLDPSVISPGLPTAQPLLNFALTNANSPYGPVYLRAIQRKLPPAVRDGVFILEVNPLLVSTNERESEDPGTFREKDLTLDRQSIFTADPNFEYLLRNFRQPLYTLLFPGHRVRPHFLHPDGWLELRVPMDPASLAERKKRGLTSYAGVFQRNRLSPLRFEYLRRTVDFLRPHGRVILFRIPTSPEMAEMERVFAPDFDTQIAQIAADHGAEYLNWIGESARFESVDGNHLSLDCARRCSAELNRWLKTSSAGR